MRHGALLDDFLSYVAAGGAEHRTPSSATLMGQPHAVSSARRLRLWLRAGRHCDEQQQDGEKKPDHAGDPG